MRSGPVCRRKSPGGANARRVLVVSGNADQMGDLRILYEDEVGGIPATCGWRIAG
jgi:hypothetical protein